MAPNWTIFTLELNKTFVYLDIESIQTLANRKPVGHINIRNIWLFASYKLKQKFLVFSSVKGVTEMYT